MDVKTYRPSPRYRTKLWIAFTILAVLILAFGVFIGWLGSHDPEVGKDALPIATIITLVLDLIWWVPAMLLVEPYYRSMSYEIQDDEVIVRVGILVHSIKHVPYRTVTNLVVNRDPLDRWFFDLGTLNIQTAGLSGTTGAEESLKGLANVQEVYEIVAKELRRFRGAMAPTQAEIEAERLALPTATLDAILTEVRAIRKSLEKIS